MACEGNSNEQAYLDLLKKIIEQSKFRMDRTKVGTFALFGESLEFDLSNGTLPLLTTKRVFIKAVIEELLWMLRGSTDAKELSNKGVKIWDANGSRDFLDKQGLLDNREGDLGPVYGFQWRHWGAEYQGADHDYIGKGCDQIAEIIRKIQMDPTDRRMILSAWNVGDLKKMALPPCHMMCQFFVEPDTKELSCQMYQRSCDMGLGVPFNIASYSLLTHIIAHLTGTKAKKFKLVMGDTHIYKTHVEALIQQIDRTPKPFPKVKINPHVVTIDDLIYEDIDIIGYDPMPTIKMPMAV